MSNRSPIEALSTFVTKPEKAQVEVFDTRFGASIRLVKRDGVGRFTDNVSLAQINSI
jgi:hypothetical protein